MIFFLINNLFYDSQYGFRPGHSTEYAAIELSDRIISAMDKNKIPLNNTIVFYKNWKYSANYLGTSANAN